MTTKESTPQESSTEIVTLVEEKVFPRRMQTAHDIWYLDTGASNHMTGDKAQFSELNLTVGDGSKVEIA
jgi:hypothetical protein